MAEILDEVALIRNNLNMAKAVLRGHVRLMFATKQNTEQNLELFVEEISKSIDQDWLNQSSSSENKDR